MCQWFAPTKLSITFETEGKGRFSAEDIEAVIVRNDAGDVVSLNLPTKFVMISNHQIYADWWYAWCLIYFIGAQGVHRNVYITLKKSLQWIPVVGWGMQLYGFIFLARSWASDRIQLASHLAALGKRAEEEDKPLCFLLYPEGTLVSPNTRPVSKKFADKEGIADLSNLLLPRSTGLYYSLRSLAPRVPDLKLIDLTVVYPGIPRMGYGQDYYTLRSIFMDGVPPPVIHIHLKMFDVATGVPIGDTAPGSSSETTHHETDVSEGRTIFDIWLRELWQEKDDLINGFFETRSFRAGGISPVEIPVKLRRKREILDAFCFFLPAGAGYLWGMSSVGYLSRKALPIKRHDAEPLTREDVQFDLLHHIFSDTNVVFTNPTPGANALCAKSDKVTFAELYISALYNSSKCSKVLREKMIETPAFATELAKISLLTNVGRINTTMAFFPEMKTALRTYHPVPSLQKTNGNAQDAPRIKNCLKAALLPNEIKSAPPSSPDEILERRVSNHLSELRSVLEIPTHLIMYLREQPLANVHFDGVLNFLDLFLPNRELMSFDRARAFLWLSYFYLESDGGQNPFADEFARKYSGKAPWLRQMTEHQRKTENVDTNEEMTWGKRMSAQRNTFLQKLVNSLDDDKKARPPPAPADSTNIAVSESTIRRPRQTHDEGAFMYYVPQNDSPSTADGGKREAWHIVTTTDPLADSDDDLEHADEHVLVDYSESTS
ncbi:hypothetical protein DXG01_000058 [Tephrocybe rancida]|nr:hypothetical protein DXG01_000058 [Tephrocybe rancida]